MIRTFRVALALAVALLALAAYACGGGSASPGETATPSATASPTTRPSPDATPSPGLSPTISPAPFGIEYTVALGDTLFSIAQRFGTTVDAIVEANGIDNPGQIEVGQVLIIPVSGTPPATVSPPPTVTQPPSTTPAEVIRIGDTSRKRVALTFDAGADTGYTALILDTLAANGITVSFGMTGRWAEDNPDLLRRIVDEGHELINHSYDHPSFTGLSTGQPPLSREERWRQLDRTVQIVAEITGATTKPYFRPPYGDYDASVNADVGARGYRYNVLWTVDSRGWMGITAGEITQRCLDLAEPGAIYVFHVGAQSQDALALQDIIDGLEARGYTMSDVSSVLP